MIQVRILHQDDDIVVIEKPPGVQVHPPERPPPNGVKVHVHLVKILRLQTGKYIYPVHRLDGATSGVMVFAFSSEAASRLQAQFKEKTVEKSYFALARGWLGDEVDYRDEEGGETLFTTYHRFEVPHAVGRYERGRYSLVLARPLTGKMHQIRRHLHSQSHPIVGDTVYGDGKHNRLWRELVPGSGLYLKAYSLRFTHPMTGERLYFRSKWGRRWHFMFEHAGFCPMKNPT
jgi:tRNA pseudouridine65 synthase